MSTNNLFYSYMSCLGGSTGHEKGQGWLLSITLHLQHHGGLNVMHNVVFSLIHHINGAGATVHMGVDLQLASGVLRQDSSSTKLEDT